MENKSKLLNELVKDKLITLKDVEEAKKIAQREKRKVEDVLSQKGKLDIEVVTEVNARLHNMPYVNLMIQDIDDRALNVVSQEVAKNYHIICFKVDNQTIHVGVTDPEDFKAQEAVNFIAKEDHLSVIFYLISDISFSKAIKQYQNISKEIGEALESKAQEEAQVEKIKKTSQKDIDEYIKSAPISKIVSVIVRHAVEGLASDIHIEPSQRECRVRYRIDGILRTSLILPKNVHNAIIARIKVLTKLKLDETRIPQDGRIRINVDGRDVDFRVSIIPLVGEEKAVMRVLDTTKGAPSLEQLGYEGRSLRLIKENIKKNHGMFLVTGPTGSGKSTTLFSVLNMMNDEGLNISTLEDPVEYFIPGVNQSQIRPEIGFNFAGGLRALLRQDPDVIMVGEIRDNETAELAIHASLTGHFVLSTLHTNDSVGSIPRLIDMHAEPFLLVSTLNIVIAQRLTRRICAHCKEETVIPEDVLKGVKKEISEIPEEALREYFGKDNIFDINNLKFYIGKGCERCQGLGYSGRVAIAEVFEIDETIKDIIMNREKVLKVDDVKKSQNFITLIQDGIIKAAKGHTTLEDVLRVIRI